MRLQIADQHIVKRAHSGEPRRGQRGKRAARINRTEERGQVKAIGNFPRPVFGQEMRQVERTELDLFGPKGVCPMTVKGLIIQPEGRVLYI